MNEEYLQEEGLSLKDIFNMLRAHWIGLLICTIIGTISGLFIGVTTPDKYQASQKVYINPEGLSIQAAPYYNNILCNFILDTEVSKEATRLVKETVNSNNLDIDVDSINYTSINKGLNVSSDSDNALCVTVNYTHTDALTAKVVLENVILATRNISYVPKPNESNESNEILDDKISILSGRIVTQVSYKELGLGKYAEVAKTSKGTTLYIGLGLVIGVIAGVAYAIIRETLDNTIKEKSYIENKYKVKVIGSIPEFVEEASNENK